MNFLSLSTGIVVAMKRELHQKARKARCLDRYYQLNCERIYLVLLEETSLGWNDVEAGRLLSVARMRAIYKSKSR
jgi:hypothetical protein